MIRLISITFFTFFIGFQSIAKDRILSQVISIELQNTSIKTILLAIEELGQVKFSYNPDLIDDRKKVSVSLRQKTIRQGLILIFDDKVRLKEVSSHILILQKEIESGTSNTPINKKTHYIIKGSVADMETGEHIPFTSVYDIDSKFSVLTDRNGYFEMKIPTSYNTISLYYAKTGYRTNIKLISLTDAPYLNGSKSIYKQIEEIDKLPSPIVPKQVWIEIEDKTISGELFSIDVSTHNENLKYLNENRWAQVSIIPQLTLKAGKNYRGILYNHFSLNILGGYSKGLKGLEVGGIANVLKENAFGVQLSGIINLVGQNFMGVQVGGISNIVKENFIGLQFSGISNTVRQNYMGIQVAGVINTVKNDFCGIQFATAGNRVIGKFNGLQIGGFVNSNEKKLNGIQISGLSSLAKDGFNGIQLSGLINHAANTSYGLQLSLIQNVALKKFVGAQITGFLNSATDGANIFQLAGLLNIANKNNGLQLSGLANYANQNNGLQLGLINISKENKGLSIGLVNFVWNGYHKIEVLTNETSIANIRVKSGVKRFYNIYSLGNQFDGHQNLTSVGFGFGAIYNISEKIAISTDIEGLVLFNRAKDFTQMAKFSTSLDFKIADFFTIFLGPTANFNYSYAPYNSIKLDNYSLYIENEGDNYLNCWLGGQFGLRF